MRRKTNIQSLNSTYQTNVSNTMIVVVINFLLENHVRTRQAAAREDNHCQQ